MPDVTSNNLVKESAKLKRPLLAVLSDTATTAELAAIGNAVNTTGKVAGRMVFNTTTNKPVWAVGANANSVWNDATGTLAHTPV